MTLRRRIIEALIVSVIVALVVVGALVIKPRPAPDFSLHVSGATTFICPAADTEVAQTRAGVDARAGDVSMQYTNSIAAVRKSLKTGSLTSADKLGGPIIITTGNGGSAAGTSVTAMTSGADRGLSMSRCKVPGVEHHFVGLQSNKTSVAQIVLTNADDGEAFVDLAIFSEFGRVSAAGSRSLTIKPNSTATIGLDSLFTQAGPVAVQVKVTQGRVAAFARVHALAESDHAPRGVEWFPSAPAAATQVVIPGVPSGPGERQLIVVNYGDEPSRVGIRLLGLNGAFAVPGKEEITVAPRSVTSIEVGKSFGGKGGSVQLTASSPVSASVTSTSADDANLDIADSVGVNAIEKTAVLPVPVGTGVAMAVSLANPGEIPAVVSYTVKDVNGVNIAASSEHTIAPFTTLALDVEKRDGTIVEIQRRSGTVHGAVIARTDTEATKGLSVLPLISVDADIARVDPQNDHRAGQ